MRTRSRWTSPSRHGPQRARVTGAVTVKNGPFQGEAVRVPAMPWSLVTSGCRGVGETIDGDRSVALTRSSWERGVVEAAALDSMSPCRSAHHRFTSAAAAWKSTPRMQAMRARARAQQPWRQPRKHSGAPVGGCARDDARSHQIDLEVLGELAGLRAGRNRVAELSGEPACPERRLHSPAPSRSSGERRRAGIGPGRVRSLRRPRSAPCTSQPAPGRRTTCKAK